MAEVKIVNTILISILEKKEQISLNDENATCQVEDT